jgi:hypothetical protein
MRSMFTTFVMGIAVGAAGMYTSLTYHVVRASDGFHLVPKMQAQFAEAYVDVRNFDASDWNEHKSLAVALANANKGHLMGDQVFQRATRVLHDLGLGK